MSKNLVQWTEETREERARILAETLRTYAVESPDLAGMKWTNQRLRLMRAELTALESGNVILADCIARLRGEREKAFADGIAN